MCDVLLIRHGMCDTVGRVIAGRGAGVHLNPVGLRQARELARMFRDNFAKFEADEAVAAAGPRV